MSLRPLKLGLVIAVSLHAFDELVLTIALPTIVRELGGGDWYGVSLASYILASLIGGVWGGVSTDQRGPLRIFLIGYSLFLIGLIVATQANNMNQFIIARCLQGLGGGISWTVAFAVTNIAIPSQQRPRMIAWLDSAWLVPSLLAPTIGGYLVDFLDWHWIFLIQIPFTVIAGFLLYPHLKPLNKTTEQTVGVANSKQQSRRALIGAIRIAIGAGIFVTVLAREVDLIWLLIPVSFFILWRPLLNAMPAGFIFAKPGLAAAVMLHFIMFFSFYGFEMFMPLMLIELRQLSSSVTGLVFTCCAISWISASFLQARLSQRWPLHQSLNRGLFVVIVGLLAVASLLIASVPLWVVFVGWTLAGFGMGIAFNSVVSATMDYTKPGEEGATSTANGIAASLGIGLSAGLGGAINNHGQWIGAGLTNSLAAIWAMTIAACLIGFWIIWRRFKHAQAETYTHLQK
jgi:MFS family permease